MRILPTRASTLFLRYPTLDDRGLTRSTPTATTEDGAVRDVEIEVFPVRSSSYSVLGHSSHYTSPVLGLSVAP